MNKAIRLALGHLGIEVTRKPKLRAHESLLNDFETLIKLPYAYYQQGGNADSTLWATHDAGLFSCLTTIMWSMIDLARLGHTCYAIDNTFGMQSFKEAAFTSTYETLFAKRSRKEVDTIFGCSPNKLTHFDHHSNFEQIIRLHLGDRWSREFVEAYMEPSTEVKLIADNFDRKYRISSAPTVLVCYRGTDKYTEIQPTPIAAYYEQLDRVLGAVPMAEILIQTDQAQIRDAFLQRYGTSCKFICELPVTRGKIVLHRERRLSGNPECFAKNLYAMCLMAGRCHTLITHTGNVGFFLALQALLAGKTVIQLD